MQFEPARRLAGHFAVPGDKSISHRALLLAAMATGSSEFTGLSAGQDVAATAACLGALGIDLHCEDAATARWRVHGVPTQAWRSPVGPLDCGNSGTTMRLLCGVLAGAPGVRSVLAGDASVSRRPMRRVADPLNLLGARVATTDTGTAPLAIDGQRLAGGTVRLAVASAQVKSALLLAGLNATAPVAVHEPAPTRDHTERMLLAMGAKLRQLPDGAVIEPGPLAPLPRAAIPGDPSAAAFAIALAVLHDEADITMRSVCLNPRRTGWLAVLARMGARVQVAADADGAMIANEPSGALRGRSSALRATDVEPAEVPDCVDELPILALCAAAATGVSTLRGLSELRVKESDRLAATARLLQTLGVEVTAGPDWLRIGGVASARNWRRVGAYDPGLDHRMALCAAVAGLCGDGAAIANWHTTHSSWPGFAEALRAVTMQ